MNKLFIIITIILLVSGICVYSLDEDGVSFTNEIIEYNTNPFTNDSDNDGLTDNKEIFKYNTNPTNPDTDGDGLTDSEEINRYNTNPNDVDTDNDNLIDGKEIKVGTNPNNLDTDGDSLSDGVEVKSSCIYPNANPLQKDIYVEVDVSENVSIDTVRKNITTLKRVFNNSPIENPNGENGIIIHSQITYTNNSTQNVREYRKTFHEELFDNKNSNYKHLLIVSDACAGQQCRRWYGSAYPRLDGAVAENRSSPVIIHEFGHLVGITNEDYKGVDDDSVSAKEYPSVMNYNYNKPYFSSDESFNDWKEINQTLKNQEVDKKTVC